MTGFHECATRCSPVARNIAVPAGSPVICLNIGRSDGFHSFASSGVLRRRWKGRSGCQASGLVRYWCSLLRPLGVLIWFSPVAPGGDYRVQERSSVRDCISGVSFRLWARYFSLLRQRKVPKRKADPTACPDGHTEYAHQGCLCFSCFWAFAQLAGRIRPRPAQTGGLTFPLMPCDARLRPREWGKLFIAPSVQPSTAEKTGLSAPPVRARSERSEIGELGARRFFRGAQGTLNGMCHSGQASGRPSLWVLSLGRARESTSPERGEIRR